MAFLFLLVFLSRVPFIDAGYGANVDAWRVARVAREIAMTGQYSVSRFPGYPVQEIVCSWFWKGGAVTLNMLTATLSAVAATAFAAIARKLQCRDWWLSGLALAATPIFFVSSVCSKDYMWAIAFVLLAILSALYQRSTIAGLLLGVAAGCRITSLAMLLPIGLILFGSGSDQQARKILQFGFSTILAGLLAFSPVWLRYGSSFFAFYDNGRPSWATILSRATVEVWGSVGLLGLTIAFGSAIWKREKAPPANKWILAAFLCGATIYLAAYLRLPDQAGYLLPIVPCSLLLLNLYAARPTWRVVCLLLVFAPLTDISPGGLIPGAIFRDHAERLETMGRIRDFLLYSEKLSGRNTIAVGAWEPQIAVLAPELLNGTNHYVYTLDAPEAINCIQKGESIFYLPLIREFNYRVTGTDLVRFGARDLHELFIREQNARPSE